MKEAQKIFDRLWSDYITQNPEVKKVYDSFVAKGEEVLNDHIAFRTFDDPKVNIDVIARPFIKAGYEFRNSYVFEQKRLRARHFEHKTFRDAPRVFISELMTSDFSPYLQEKVNEIIAKIPDTIINNDELVFSGNVWGKPSYEVYQHLRDESEYAAWLYVYGFRANHFTVSINGLKNYDTIEKVNQFLKDNGFMLNDSGGEIKGTPAELLEQSSTKAGILTVDFIEGKHDIPSCYYEFARRYPDADGKIYSGFIAKSADKIFESTDFYKK
ncbi:MAG: DUF1338 domain-containing protein [Bacteroidales bacterium]|jgi:hypothetical protein|nr:DUF1338 domain-containing protein [Bacteroidales bacterium]